MAISAVNSRRPDGTLAALSFFFSSVSLITRTPHVLSPPFSCIARSQILITLTLFFTGSAFSQQTLKAWRPILTPRLVILLFVLVGLVFIPFGAVVVGVSNQVVEVESEDYSGSKCCVSGCDTVQTWQREDNNPCSVSLLVTEKMEAPIYLYYKLTNYYQNHRRYVRSRSDAQLMGEDVTLDDIAGVSSCNFHVQHDPSDANSLISPCGLIAWSYFNDSFKILKPDGATEVALDDSAIAWATDKDTKFKNSPNGSTGSYFPNFAYERQQNCSSLPTPAKQTECLESPASPAAGWCYPGSGYCVENEHFMVWMRAAGLPSFRKLYAVINEDLDPGNYTVMVSNGVEMNGEYMNAWDNAPQTFLYPVQSFGGTKSIVLSTKSWIGGRNFFIGYAYVTVGAVCIVLALCFLIKYKACPRDLADANYISHKGL